MKRLLITFSILLNVIFFIGCDSKTSLLSSGQQKAVKNSIEFISSSSFASKNRIDTDVIQIRNATETTWKSVWAKGSQIEENAIDSTDWVIMIGDTTAHDFAIIACDSSTYEVIGYIPIE